MGSSARVGNAAREPCSMIDLLDAVREALATAPDARTLVAALRTILHEHAPQRAQPVDYVQWVPIERVSPNTYNPNHVAQIEMELLYTSIAHDGYTQPVVTIWDPAQDKWVIVDGFHRYYVMKTRKDIYDACHGLLPIVELKKTINDRMASTVRHNRARGKHSVQGMSSMVLTMLENGWGDGEICHELGMNAEELLRLKHITGFSKLFADVEYQQAWMTMNQVRLARQYQGQQAGGEPSSPVPPSAPRRQPAKPSRPSGPP